MFLNERHDFHRVDGIIPALVGCSMVFWLIGLLGLSVPFEIVMATAALAALLVYCAINLVFAARIRMLRDDPFCLLRPFAFLTIAASVPAPAVILSPLGLLASMGAIILAGMTLPRAREEMEIL